MKKKKTQRRVETPIIFSYPTSDDWHPNFPRNTIEFRVHLFYDCLSDKIGLIRISVSGADDTGMERDECLPVVDYPKRLEEIRFWLENKLPNPVSMDWLRDQGFQFY